MKRFSDILICCDIDGTLIDNNLKLPESNLRAIKTLRDDGGLFTIATGRTYQGAGLYLEAVKPDTPFVCQNGSAIYSADEKKYLWWFPLPDSAHEVIDYVRARFPHVGIEIMTNYDSYCIQPSNATKQHESDEKINFTCATIDNIRGDLLKVVFADEPTTVDKIQAMLEVSPYFGRYKMARSYPTYYEYVNIQTNKAQAVMKLSEITGISLDNIIVIGDNDNDCDMLSLPCRSFVPSSASENAKKCADCVLERNNNDGVLPELLERIAVVTAI